MNLKCLIVGHELSKPKIAKVTEVNLIQGERVRHVMACHFKRCGKVIILEDQ